MCENMSAPMRGETMWQGLQQDLRSINITVRTIVDRNASAAEVTYVVSDSEGGTVYRTTGSSKREPGDPFFADLGEQLAVSRAIEKLSIELNDSDDAEQLAVASAVEKLAIELRDTVYESFPWNEEPLVTLDSVVPGEDDGIPEEYFRAYIARMLQRIKDKFSA